MLNSSQYPAKGGCLTRGVCFKTCSVVPWQSWRWLVVLVTVSFIWLFARLLFKGGGCVFWYIMIQSWSKLCVCVPMLCVCDRVVCDSLVWEMWFVYQWGAWQCGVWQRCVICENVVRDAVVFSCVCVCLCCSLCDNVARCLPHNKYFIASFSGRTCSACHIICRGATATRATHNHGKVAHRLPHKWCLSRMSSRKQLASHQTKPVHPSKPRVINATPAVTMLCVCMGVYVWQYCVCVAELCVTTMF